MYRILVNDKTVEITESPRFTRYDESSQTWVPCQREVADAISVHGHLYNLITNPNKIANESIAFIKEEAASAIFAMQLEENEELQNKLAQQEIEFNAKLEKQKEEFEKQKAEFEQQKANIEYMSAMSDIELH